MVRGFRDLSFNLWSKNYILPPVWVPSFTGRSTVINNNRIYDSKTYFTRNKLILTTIFSFSRWCGFKTKRVAEIGKSLKSKGEVGLLSESLSTEPFEPNPAKNPGILNSELLICLPNEPACKLESESELAIERPSNALSF